MEYKYLKHTFGPIINVIFIANDANNTSIFWFQFSIIFSSDSSPILAKEPLPFARTISNTLAIGDNKYDMHGNNVLLALMGQFIDHDITFTPTPGFDSPCAQCQGETMPTDFKKDSCMPIEIPKDDTFWKGKGKACMVFERSVHGPDLKCNLTTREQLNQVQ